MRKPCSRRALLFLLVLAVATSIAMAEEAAKNKTWVPEVPDGMPQQWDWIQLTSLEWLKGEFIALYDDKVEFESDELDTLMIEWEDIKRVRTARIMDVRLAGRDEVKGRITVDDDVIRVMQADGTERTLTRAQLVSMTIGTPKELAHWKMKISIGVNTRTGNTNVTEANLSSTFARRSSINRFVLDTRANYNTTEGELVSDNTRANVTWDRFATEKVFFKPVFVEYYRDPFKNIARQTTLGVGAGYHIVDKTKTEWDISGGPAYQRTLFDDVLEGEAEREDTPALVIESASEMKVAKWMDFDTLYRFQLTNEESGTYNHHMVISFEFDITELLDFNIEWIWDRIQNPRENADGTVPQQDDYRTQIMLGFDF